GIALRWRIDPYLTSRVCGWQEPIERVLGNLIDYAIGANEAGAVRVAVAAGQTRFTIEFVLAKDTTTTEISPGSASCPVLIVTADSLFAGEVCEYLEGWDAAVLWIGEAEAALEYIAWLDPAVRAVLLVDGRTKPIAAMGLVDRALG